MSKKNTNPQEENVTGKAKKKKTKSTPKVDENAAELELLKTQLSESTDKLLRLNAEFDNYRKRTLKEKMELTKNAGEGVLKNLLPVVDDFERGLKSLGEASDLAAVKEGIELIYNRFLEFLSKNGVKEIDAIGLDFDTDIHEAITKIPSPSEDQKGKVIDCTEKGYFLHDKVMRYAKVVVGE